MKASTISQLTWQDLREIVTEAHMMSTIPEDLAIFETPEEYYTCLPNRLRRRSEEPIESPRQALFRDYYYGD